MDGGGCLQEIESGGVCGEDVETFTEDPFELILIIPIRGISNISRENYMNMKVDLNTASFFCFELIYITKLESNIYF